MLVRHPCTCVMTLAASGACAPSQSGGKKYAIVERHPETHDIAVGMTLA